MTETTKATAIPVSRMTASADVNARPNFSTLIRLAPNITGTARKNVNSAAAGLAIPIRIAPKIVAPEREVPGKIAAIN